MGRFRVSGVHGEFGGHGEATRGAVARLQVAGADWARSRMPMRPNRPPGAGGGGVVPPSSLTVRGSRAAPRTAQGLIAPMRGRASAGTRAAGRTRDPSPSPPPSPHPPPPSGYRACPLPRQTSPRASGTLRIQRRGPDRTRRRQNRVRAATTAPTSGVGGDQSSGELRRASRLRRAGAARSFSVRAVPTRARAPSASRSDLVNGTPAVGWRRRGRSAACRRGRRGAMRCIQDIWFLDDSIKITVCEGSHVMPCWWSRSR